MGYASLTQPTGLLKEDIDNTFSGCQDAHMPEDLKQQYIVKMGEPLGKLFFALWNEVAWLHYKWNEYREFFDMKESRIHLMNEAAPMFFRFFQDMLIDDILLRIARLTDPPESRNKANLTITRLPKFIEEGNITIEVQELISKALESATFCRDLRNKRIAHYDLKLALKEGAEFVEPATKEKIQTALDSIVDVMNKVEYHFRRSTTFYEMGFVPNASVLQLLSLLKRGLKSKKEWLEKLKNGEFNPDDMPGEI
ncbi:MAG: hypothetical protein H3C68_00320 [Deltaproteobacteria bacterium]|nr:hypothetical protein [Deltaproteobacteria bacterium]MBZ0219307.1 hypothetical protein [Deltaproteobacteria bacterium]